MIIIGVHFLTLGTTLQSVIEQIYANNPIDAFDTFKTLGSAIYNATRCKE